MARIHVWMMLLVPAAVVDARRDDGEHDAVLNATDDGRPVMPFSGEGYNKIPYKPQLCFGSSTNPHSWLTHGYECTGMSSDEKLGCFLPGYAKNMVGVHWNVAGEDNDRLYSGYQACQDRPDKQFPIPDYCSRAMVAELEQIFDGKHRIASTVSAAKHIFASDNSTCGYWSTDTVKNIFSLTPSSEACWGFTNAYKTLYCAVYQECKSGRENPNEDDNAVQCCRNMWDQRESRYAAAGILDGMRALPRSTLPGGGGNGMKQGGEVKANAPGGVVASSEWLLRSKFL